jgi:hypothetical protein
MAEVTVKTQKEWDALPKSFPEFTIIKIVSSEPIMIRKNPDNSRAVLRESSRAVLWESSSAVLRESSRAVLRESSRAVLRESSRAVLWESSSAELWESSSAELWESSSAVLWESSSAELWESSSAEAFSTSTLHIKSDFASAVLMGFCVAFLIANKAKIKKQSKTATIIKPVKKSGANGWLEENGIKDEPSVVLFKRVSADFKTQENTENETLWTLEETLNHPSWSPKEAECGGGKYHACSRPYFCDEFRSNDGCKYIAIKILKRDLYAWPNAEYHHKIAFRKGTVLYECDRFGDKLEPKK